MREVKGVKGSSIAHFVHGLFLLSAVFLLLTFLLMLIKRPSTHQPLSQQKAQVNDATLTKNYTAHYPVFSRPTIDTTIR
ncbi:MAG TPA: hypothetical protein VFT59_06010, partial [Candidatus Saccharimonadales bacterium]|nr:hypothetical protein [Candidatus Saccharimonadales bacterium]